MLKLVAVPFPFSPESPPTKMSNCQNPIWPWDQHLNLMHHWILSTVLTTSKILTSWFLTCITHWYSAVVLPKSGSVRFLGKNCKPWTERRFRFSHMAEPWTECTWTHSGGPVHIWTRFENWTCLKINKYLEYICFACIACNLQNIQDEMHHSDRQLKSGKFESFIYPDFDPLHWY